MNALLIHIIHALPTPLGLLIKITVILIAAWLVCQLLKRSSASTRHLIWSAALIAVFLLPVLSLALPRWEVVFHKAPAAPMTAQSVAPPAPLLPALPDAAKSVSVKPSSAAVAKFSPHNIRPGGNPTISVARPHRFMPFAALLTGAGIWLVGFIIVLGQFVLGLRRIGQIRKQAVSLDASTLAMAETIRQHLDIRPVTFLRATQNDVAVPVTWGALRPIILLPAQSASWSDDCLRAALLHELAHIRRGDWLMQTLSRLTCAVYWWHPLVWFAARQAREESERACDDFVLGTGMGAADYAQRLVEVVRSMPEAKYSRTIAIAMAQPSEVEGRVEAVLDKRRNRSRPTKTRLATVLTVVCLLLLPLSALRPIARAGTGTASVYSDASLGQFMPTGRGILELNDLQSVASPGAANASEQPYQIETFPNADGTQSNILVNIKTGARYRDPKTVQDALQKLIDHGYTERPGASAYLIPLNLAIDVPTRAVFFTPAQRKRADALEVEKKVFLDLLDKSPVVVTDADLASAAGHLDDRSQPVLDLKFTATGARKLKAFTASHLGAVLGIFVDGGLISAPKIVAEIDDGFAQISGGFRTLAEVQTLAKRLNQPTYRERITPTSYDSISPDGTEMIVRGGAADAVPVAMGSEAKLPNGYTVGIAGLAQAVRAGEKWSMFGGPWWKPDGTPLAAPLDPASAGFWDWSVHQHDGNAPYVVKFTVAPRQTNATTPGQEISTYEEFIGAENRLAQLDRMPFTRGEGSYGGSTVSIYFAPGTKTCAVRCGVAAGPWRTAGTLPVHLTPDTVRLPKSSRPYDRAAVEFKLDDRPALIYDSIDGKHHTEYFLGPERLKNVARRIVAVEASGEAIPLQVMENGGWGLQFISLGFDKSYSLAYFNPSVKLADVRAFRLETRPYQIVEFKNVQLQPNGGTGNATAQDPVRAREDFKTVVALYNADDLNMRRLDLTIMMYMQDHDGTFPPMKTLASLEAALEPYLKQQEKSPDPETHQPYTVRDKAVFISPLTGKPYRFASDLSNRHDSEIKSPATTVLFTDAASPAPGGMQRGFDAFADGHVKQLTTIP